MKNIKQKGLLIVIEGLDGTGKGTQKQLLANRLKKEHIPSFSMSFPVYHSRTGKKIAAYLRGEKHSTINNPYRIATLFADDRKNHKSLIMNALRKGKVVVLDRYVSSNFYQMARFSRLSEQKAFKSWLLKIEYEKNKMPADDKVIYLSLPIPLSSNLVFRKKERVYLNGKKKDLHEQNQAFLKKVEKVYKTEAGSNKKWTTLHCSKNGKVLPPGKIHSMIYHSIQPLLAGLKK